MVLPKVNFHVEAVQTLRNASKGGTRVAKCDSPIIVQLYYKMVKKRKIGRGVSQFNM